jgi:hypothetical protein
MTEFEPKEKFKHAVIVENKQIILLIHRSGVYVSQKSIHLDLKHILLVEKCKLFDLYGKGNLI